MGLFSKKKKVDYDVLFKEKYKSINQLIMQANNELDFVIKESLYALVLSEYDELLSYIDQGANYDKDHIISASGNLKKDYINKNLSSYLISFIERRVSIFENHVKKISIISDVEIEGTYCIEPIIVSGDVIGLFIIMSPDKTVGSIEEQIAKIGSVFFQKYIEE